MTPMVCGASVLRGSRKREALKLRVTLLRLVTEVVSIIANVLKVGIHQLYYVAYIGLLPSYVASLRKSCRAEKEMAKRGLVVLTRA
ncbi:hypothetical protein B0H67DRAFT_392493 [Lasiosphaeris hirsuta]|uniref:Uncharacterized protein n=1 Tax=Lasiosphaeris hirsuta TaxID=260670 RepID=A0AA40DJA2_9PEZI|nr:hypothetical protein B0H67DRAFT_392493 [Lasiosphaeris hirsuta]